MPKSATSSPAPDKTKVPPGSLDHLGEIQRNKWEIIYKEPYGRCIVAKQDIKAGDLLFVDHPIVTGPKQDRSDVCLGCYGQLEKESIHLCSKCGWPLCSPKCESKGYHLLECEVFSKSKFKFNIDDFRDDNPLYECILPLRCLLLQGRDDRKWTTLMAMESHDNIRRDTELWNTEQTNVCDVLRERAQVTVGDALVHTITGVLDVNCHEVKYQSTECRVRGLYPLCAMMSHDCFSNTHHTFLDDMTMLMVACRDIPKGAQITGIYTHLLSGTTERRKHLNYGKFFDCVCSRCSDPTELGTYFSALRCTKHGCPGNVLCKNPLQEDNKADYACDKCGHQVAVSMVSRLTNLVYYELQSLGSSGDPRSLELLYSKYRQLLHPNHFHLIGIKHSLSQMYGRYPGYLITELTEEQMDRKVECCRDVLAVMDLLDPGISRLTGLTKYELHAPLLIRVNREFQLHQLTREEFLGRLGEALQLLEDTSSCLQYETSCSYEGEVCEIARKSAGELRSWITTVQTLPEEHFVPKTCISLDDDPDPSQEDLTLEALLRKVESY